ncbi:MAG: hypothetical protein EB021_09285 [Gammaproteobacteria bacterium]|nr:hypothetical protein [Gammaproteobacteria bacterium]
MTALCAGVQSKKTSKKEHERVTVMKGRNCLIGLLAALTTLGTASAEGLGWVLNRERSAMIEGSEGPAPSVQPVAAKALLMLVSTGVAPRGREGELTLRGDELTYNAEVRFAAKLDGRDYPIHGLSQGDSIAIEVASDDAVVSTIKSSGNKVVSFKRSVAEDEKTMVVTARYFGEGGKVAARERLIFERR